MIKKEGRHSFGLVVSFVSQIADTMSVVLSAATATATANIMKCMQVGLARCIQ